MWGIALVLIQGQSRRTLPLHSDVDLLGDLDGVTDLDAEVTHGVPSFECPHRRQTALRLLAGRKVRAAFVRRCHRPVRKARLWPRLGRAVEIA